MTADVDTTATTTSPRAAADAAAPRQHGLVRWWRRQSALLLTGYAVVLATAALAFLVPLLAPEDAGRVDPGRAYLPPLSDGHLLGTDQIGRDMLLRVAGGLRASLLISGSAVAAAICIGLLVGLVAGYYGGAVETVLMRLTDVQMALPFIVLAVMILSIAEPSYVSLTLVLCLAVWPAYARAVRSSTRLEKDANYVQGIKILGGGNLRVLRKYLLPAALAPLAVLAVLDMAALILFEATLGFLGIGSPPDSPSLGSIMADGKQFITSAWWISVVPGLVTFAAILGINLVGVALRERKGQS